MSETLEYTPVCPFGCKDCTNDPAFHQAYEPWSYGEAYEDKDPSVVVKVICPTPSANTPKCPSYRTDMWERHEF